MTENLYQAPNSNLEKSTTAQLGLPSAFKVGLTLLLLSAAIGIGLAILESFIGKNTHSNILSTVIPAIAIGGYYGKKRGQIFPSKFRLAVVFIWFLGSLLITAAIFVLFIPGAISQFVSAIGLTIPLIILIVGIFLLIGFGVSYAMLHAGEKIGVKQYLKQNKHNTTITP